MEKRILSLFLAVLLALVPTYVRPRGLIIIEEAPACFKRLVTGRSLVERHVRKTILCDSLRSCEEACAQEHLFNCEGFNFRFDKNGYDSLCQLTTIPGSMLDITADFNSDRDVDYFERDRNAPRSCTHPYADFRPWNQYGMGGGNWDRRPDYSGGSYEGMYPQDYPHDHNRLGPPQPPPPSYNTADSWDYPWSGGDKRYDSGGGQHAYGLGSGWGLPDECFVRTKAGFRLERNVVIVSLTVPSLYDCEKECVNERKFSCNVFSYRYSLTPSVPGDNCHLGERSFRSLDAYTDLIPDRDYDVYERNRNGMEDCQPKRYWGSGMLNQRC